MTIARILIADDHEVVRHGLRKLLEAQSGWQVVAEASDGREAVAQASRCKPNVVVMDFSMPGMNGLEATIQILKAVPATEVLVLTVHESEDVARKVLAAGARGYMLKSDAGRELVAAVQSLLKHRVFLTSRISEMVLKGYVQGLGSLPDDELAPGRSRPANARSCNCWRRATVTRKWPQFSTSASTPWKPTAPAS